jgi:hypothetical protein
MPVLRVGHVFRMQERRGIKAYDKAIGVAEVRAALERRRPAGGDLTGETRRLLREARQREARFQRRRSPVEPLS